jgi:hypothetical protein
MSRPTEQMKVFTSEPSKKSTFNEDNPYKDDRTRTSESGAWETGFSEGKSGKLADQTKFNIPAMQSLKTAYLEGHTKGSEKDPAKDAIRGGKSRKQKGKMNKKTMKKTHRGKKTNGRK